MRLVYMVGAAAVWTVLSHQQAAVWQSDLTLWAHAHAVAPQMDRPRVNYAKALYGAGRVGEALELLR